MIDRRDTRVSSAQIYHSARLAEGYAFARPPVHPHVIRLVAERLGITSGSRVPRALDIGCGAGLSAAALAPIARAVVAIDPAATMLAHAAVVAPGARCAVARAERLPFSDGSFDLVAAGGALNYADRTPALAEMARVLTPRGFVVIYDFSAGRRLREHGRLDAWFTAFERRYPFPAGYAMDAAGLDYAGSGLHLSAYDTFETCVTMDFDRYVRYVLSETNVERAISSGTSEAKIEGWCRATLQPLFHAGALDVMFDGYVAYAARPA